MALGSFMLMAGKVAKTKDEAEKMLKATITDGSALKKFADFVEAQGGDPEFVYNTEKFAKAKFTDPVASPVTGYVESIKADEIGICSLVLGGGRETKESTIDLSVGLILNKKLGDKVDAGEVIATLYTDKKYELSEAEERFLKAYTISENRVEPGPVIL